MPPVFSLLTVPRRFLVASLCVWFHVWHLWWCPYFFLISHFFGALGGFFFVIMAFPGYLHLYLCVNWKSCIYQAYLMLTSNTFFWISYQMDHWIGSLLCLIDDDVNGRWSCSEVFHLKSIGIHFIIAKVKHLMFTRKYMLKCLYFYDLFRNRTVLFLFQNEIKFSRH